MLASLLYTLLGMNERHQIILLSCSKTQQVEGFTRMKIAIDFVATNWDGTVARVYFAYSGSFAEVSFTVKSTIP